MAKKHGTTKRKAPTKALPLEPLDGKAVRLAATRALLRIIQDTDGPPPELSKFDLRVARLLVNDCGLHGVCTAFGVSGPDAMASAWRLLRFPLAGVSARREV